MLKLYVFTVFIFSPQFAFIYAREVDVFLVYLGYVEVMCALNYVNTETK